MRKGSEGFSLVELVVSMAILVIVGVAMISFFTYCVNQSKKTSDEINLQYESQLCQNRLQQQILAATDSVGFKSKRLTLYGESEQAGVIRKTKTEIYQQDHQLMFQDYVYDSDWLPVDENGSVVAAAQPQCFAGYVNDFQVRFFDEHGTQITSTSPAGTVPTKADIRVQMQAGERSFEATESVAIRNAIGVAEVD